MAKKAYTVTLEEEDVDKAKKKLKENGAKLSPIINILLNQWSEADD